jgi:hypothetical protein
MATTEFVADMVFSIFLEVGDTNRELLNLRSQSIGNRSIAEPRTRAKVRMVSETFSTA